MNTEGLHKEIKQSLRLLMNGVTAQSLREKGMDYHLNWGVNLLHLREMASQYEPSLELATLLWADNIRECKILATMLMPPTEFSEQTAREWINQTPTQEIAEIACKNLYCKLPFAKDLAISLITSPDAMLQLYGYCIIGSLRNLSPEEKQQITLQANNTINNTTLPLGLRHAAHNALMRLEK
jgi:hypothetical protein